MATSKTCDRCKRKFSQTDDYTNGRARLSHTQYHGDDGSHPHDKKYDLCTACVGQLVRFLEETAVTHNDYPLIKVTAQSEAKAIAAKLMRSYGDGAPQTLEVGGTRFDVRPTGGQFLVSIQRASHWSLLVYQAFANGWQDGMQFVVNEVDEILGTKKRRNRG